MAARTSVFIWDFQFQHSLSSDIEGKKMAVMSRYVNRFRFMNRFVGLWLA